MPPFIEDANTFTALNIYLEMRVQQKSTDSSNWTFLYRCKPLSSRYCQQRLFTYGKQCDLKLSPHQLRYTCATLMLNAGISISTIQEILGHRQIDMTVQYAHLSGEAILATCNHS